jgi:holo-[acyl-carrier protein] synthase
MLAAGVDIVEIERVKGALERFGRRFLQRVYTAEEAAFCRDRPWELAGRFAAKEAVMKALGTGARGVAWREIEVLPNRRGKPLVYLYGRAQQRAEAMGLEGVEVSISHSRDYAVAMAVAQVPSEAEGDRDGWRQELTAMLREHELL